jgi:hypothetical protein
LLLSLGVVCRAVTVSKRRRACSAGALRVLLPFRLDHINLYLLRDGDG